jgi:effector-binding domain-containing protein
MSPAARVKRWSLPRGEVSYGELGRWVADHALAVAGPVRERYLRGPRDSGDTASWRTEIGWPVFRLA